MNKMILPLVLVFVLIGAGCRGGGESLVKVGNRSIMEKDLDLLVRVNPRLKMRLATPDGKQKILENYVDQELLYQESLKRGLRRSSAVKDKLNLYEKIIVAQALLDDELDRKTREHYENHRDEFERVKISHILIRTEPPQDQPVGSPKKTAAFRKRPEGEALKMIAAVKERLAKGGDFGEVAKTSSEDERTKGGMGDLGFITIKDRRLERWGWLPIAEKAFAMKVGEISDPIKTREGFHLIKVTEGKSLQPFEEVEAGIKFRIQGEIRTTFLEDLKKKYKVTWAKAATPPPPPETAAAPTTQPSSESVK